MSDDQADKLDVSRLPTFAFGDRSLMWWGTGGMMLIESMLFAVTIMSYFYLRSHASAWPPGDPPELLYGSINMLVMLLSGIPNEWTKRAAEGRDLRKVRIGLLICMAFSLAFLVVRIFEFGALNVRWDGNAYGSVVWMLLGLHTAHLLTDTYDSAVLTVLMFSGPIEGKRFVDVAENGLYWYFVVLSWLPIYAVIYWAPRF